MKEKTDWDAYYDKPYKTALYSRYITRRKLIRLIKKYCPIDSEGIRMIELGGANSCFYDLITDKIKPSFYKIVDNNKSGLERFCKRFKHDSANSSECIDILEIDQLEEMAFDLSFSIGVIEHFSVDDTAKAIAAHFKVVRNNGICIISFPTPTWLYRVSRKVSELLRMWIFWDERPLKFKEVENEIIKHGIILHKSIIWPILLTQGIIVAKKT